MTQEQSKVTEVLDLKPEQIAEYLRVNPEFFEQNSDLLVDIKIPHLNAQGTISIIERQVEVLRHQNALLKEQLKNFTSLASENELLWMRFKDYAVFLIKQLGQPDRISMTEQWLKQAYNLSNVRLIGNFELLSKLPQSLLERVQTGQIQCGANVPQESINVFFADNPASIQSLALIPLKNPKNLVQGLLILGAQEIERFSFDQSTAYLECLRALTGQAILQS